MSASQIRPFNPTVALNVFRWRKTHPVTPTALEREYAEQAAREAQERRDRWFIKQGRLTSVAQALACARRAA